MSTSPAAVARLPLDGSYADLLSGLADAGYSSRPFGGVEPGKRHVMLRHDVDACPERALRMAHDEAEMGWTAMYFVLPTSGFYNVLEPRVNAMLRGILALGHQIGLHLEIDENDPSRTNMEAKAQREATILQHAVDGLQVEWMSFHQPTKNKEAIAGYLEAEMFGGLRNAYARHLKNDVDVAYRADSGGNWYASAPLDHPLVVQGKPLQLLTHPIWWYDNTSDPVATARSFCNGLDSTQRAAMTDYFLRRYPGADISR